MNGHRHSRKSSYLQWCKAEPLLMCYKLASCTTVLMSGASIITASVHFLLHQGTINCCFLVVSPVMVHAAGQIMSLGSDRWPQGGHLQFCGVQLKYSREAPYALAGVSFELRPGQKVGICGRTGQLSASPSVSARYLRTSKDAVLQIMHGHLPFHCHSFNDAIIFLTARSMHALLYKLLTSFNSIL